MNDPYMQLRSEYIDALRSVTPEIERWWFDHCPYLWTDPIPMEAMTDFHRRWPVGPAAHPRIIDLFRKYYFAVWDLNERLATERNRNQQIDENSSQLWGFDSESGTASQVRPIDLLVNDLSTVAPDLFEIMQGFVFLPIGMTLDGKEC